MAARWIFVAWVTSPRPPWSIQSRSRASWAALRSRALDLLPTGGMTRSSSRWAADFEEEAFGALARDEAGTGGAALEDELRGLEVEVALGLGLVVAGEAVVAEEGEDLAFEIDGGIAFQFGDRQRGGGAERKGGEREEQGEGGPAPGRRGARRERAR